MSIITTTSSAAVIVGARLACDGCPELPGIDTFHGTVLHTAHWDNRVRLDGKRVAVLGAGAECGRIVPELVDRARSVKVFQNSPDWTLPQHRWLTALLSAVPASHARGSVVTTALQGLARAYLRVRVHDPWLRRQLTPGFRMGGAYVLISSDYYPALQKTNCKLISWPVYAVSANGIRTAEGIEHEVDCIVIADAQPPRPGNSADPRQAVGRTQQSGDTKEHDSTA